MRRLGTFQYYCLEEWKTAVSNYKAEAIDGIPLREGDQEYNDIKSEFSKSMEATVTCTILEVRCQVIMMFIAIIHIYYTDLIPQVCYYN